MSRFIFTSDKLPEIVTLCGSTRFFEQFQEANFRLTMEGKIVLSVGFYPHAPQMHGEGVGVTAEQKVALDELHKRKIDLSDRVLVLNVGGYIGSSTRGEIEHAEKRGVPIDYLEAPPARGEPVSSDNVCPAFVWVGQTFRSCDRCGNPYWEHTHREGRPSTPFGPDDSVPERITPEEGAAVRAKWQA